MKTRMNKFNIKNVNVPFIDPEIENYINQEFCLQHAKNDD